MKRIKNIIIIVLCYCCIFFKASSSYSNLLSCKDNLHPFHVSVCEIVHNPKTNKLEIMIKLFSDDLEDAISAQSKVKLHLNSPKEMPNADQYIIKYVEYFFKIFINNEVQKLQFVGREQEADADWIYFEILIPSTIQNISIHNSLIMNLYGDQVNFVHITALNTPKSARLTKFQPKFTIEYN